MSAWPVTDEDLASVAARRSRKVIVPRPGHADLAGALKYDLDDVRNVLERASARETAARVAAGAIAKDLLALRDRGARSRGPHRQRRGAAARLVIGRLRARAEATWGAWTPTPRRR